MYGHPKNGVAVVSSWINNDTDQHGDTEIVINSSQQAGANLKKLVITSHSDDAGGIVTVSGNGTLLDVDNLWVTMTGENTTPGYLSIIDSAVANVDNLDIHNGCVENSSTLNSDNITFSGGTITNDGEGTGTINTSSMTVSNGSIIENQNIISQTGTVTLGEWDSQKIVTVRGGSIEASSLEVTHAKLGLLDTPTKVTVNSYTQGILSTANIAAGSSITTAEIRGQLNMMGDSSSPDTSITTANLIGTLNVNGGTLNAESVSMVSNSSAILMCESGTANVNLLTTTQSPTGTLRLSGGSMTVKKFNNDSVKLGYIDMTGGTLRLVEGSADVHSVRINGGTLLLGTQSDDSRTSTALSHFGSTTMKVTSDVAPTTVELLGESSILTCANSLSLSGADTTLKLTGNGSSLNLFGTKLTGNLLMDGAHLIGQEDDVHAASRIIANRWEINSGEAILDSDDVWLLNEATFTDANVSLDKSTFSSTQLTIQGTRLALNEESRVTLGAYDSRFSSFVPGDLLVDTLSSENAGVDPTVSDFSIKNSSLAARKITVDNGSSLTADDASILTAGLVVVRGTTQGQNETLYSSLTLSGRNAAGQPTTLTLRSDFLADMGGKVTVTDGAQLHLTGTDDVSAPHGNMFLGKTGEASFLLQDSSSANGAPAAQVSVAGNVTVFDGSTLAVRDNGVLNANTRDTSSRVLMEVRGSLRLEDSEGEGPALTVDGGLVQMQGQFFAGRNSTVSVMNGGAITASDTAVKNASMLAVLSGSSLYLNDTKAVSSAQTVKLGEGTELRVDGTLRTGSLVGDRTASPWGNSGTRLSLGGVVTDESGTPTGYSGGQFSADNVSLNGLSSALLPVTAHRHPRPSIRPTGKRSPQIRQLHKFA